MRLHDIAYARAGDKGNISDISLVAYRAADYPILREYVTAERVRAHFADVVPGRVERYVLPQLFALKFVLHGALDGGVTRTVNLDAHGKALGSCLLELDLPDLAVVHHRSSQPSESRAQWHS
ncbi:hypothetical protein [Nonomuraea lactucae]|uniref:AtuA-related protein n=1 Tax=Nonomuraea lactucae TaxID=2249762 RepID=UPI000DE3F168|nr:hypothetical protein [Nonomuraea lactucae]